MGGPQDFNGFYEMHTDCAMGTPWDFIGFDWSHSNLAEDPPYKFMDLVEFAAMLQGRALNNSLDLFGNAFIL